MAANNFPKNFPKFEGIERTGFFALMGIILLLLITRFTLHYFIQPASPVLADSQMLAALKSIDTSQRGQGTLLAAELFPFDPNTLDSAGFIRLGLPARTVKGLMNWQRHGKVFYAKEEFKALYHLKPEEYERLAPYMVISAQRPAYDRREWNKGSGGFTPKTAPAPASIEINSADSTRLISLRGIGPATAHHILEKRRALGGFLRPEQLNEIFPPLPDSVKQYFSVNPAQAEKMNLNTVSLERLAQHPYIGEKMAKNILLLREGLKQFAHIEQLRQVPLMNEEKYRKIAPYFTVGAE